MALFPKIETKYSSGEDKCILDQMEQFYNDSITLNQYYWTEADLDSRFESGDQEAFSEVYGSLPMFKKKQFSFNKIRPIVEMISGYQRRNRKSTIVVPVENGDSKTADQYTKLMYWCNQQEGILETISDSFHGALVTGMNLMQVWMDYRDDPVSGNIKVENCAYNSFLIDPYFKKADLSDCNGIWKRSWLTKREIQSLMPEMADDITETYGKNAGDGKFQYMPESYNFNQSERLTYDEFYYRTYRMKKVLVDTESGETIEWQGDKKDLEEFLRFYPQVTTVETEVPTVNLAVVVEGKVLYNGPNPVGIDSYPFVPVFAYYNPQLPYFYNRIQGVVRSLRDPQFLFNRFAVNIADVVESQLNSGWVYKENAVVNPRDLFQSGNGRVIALKEESQMTDVQKIQPGEASSSMFQLTQLFSDLTTQVSGVNEELLGSAMDDKAGILAMLRQGAGLTTLQRLFDQLDYSQKLLGKIVLQIIQTNFTPGKVERIIEEEPTEQFYNKTFGKYDSAVEEGLNTTTQKQLQFAQMLKLREVGVPISDEDIIEASTMQGKQGVIERMQQQQQQAQQMEQAQMQQQMEVQRAQMQLLEANSLAQRGLGIERLSRVNENQALAEERSTQAQENLAQARKEDDMALLNLAKAIKEIQNVDLKQLQKLIELEKVMDQRHQVEQPIVPPQPTLQEQYAQLAALQQQQNINNQQDVY